MDKKRKIQLLLHILLIVLALVLLTLGAMSKDIPRILVACVALAALGLNMKKIFSSKD